MASRRGEIPGNLSMKSEAHVEVFAFSHQRVLHVKSEIPLIHPVAIESGTSSGIFGALSSPIGMTRRNISYDELMDAPMHSPPSDMSVNILWKDPVIPQHRFRNAAEVPSCLFSRVLYMLLKKTTCPWLGACVNPICLPVCLLFNGTVC